MPLVVTTTRTALLQVYQKEDMLAKAQQLSQQLVESGRALDRLRGEGQETAEALRAAQEDREMALAALHHYEESTHRLQQDNVDLAQENDELGQEKDRLAQENERLAAVNSELREALDQVRKHTLVFTLAFYESKVIRISCNKQSVLPCEPGARTYACASWEKASRVRVPVSYFGGMALTGWCFRSYNFDSGC